MAEASIVHITVIGDERTGKSNIVSRFIEGSYLEKYKPTIGAEIKIRTIKFDDIFVKLNIWDSGGYLEFRNIVKSYFRRQNGALVVFDVTKRETFENVPQWIEEFKGLALEGHKMIIVGNKKDLSGEREVTREEGQLMSDRYGVPYFETSAKDGSCIDLVFKKILRMIKDSGVWQRQ